MYNMSTPISTCPRTMAHLHHARDFVHDSNFTEVHDDYYNPSDRGHSRHDDSIGGRGGQGGRDSYLRKQPILTQLSSLCRGLFGPETLSHFVEPDPSGLGFWALVSITRTSRNGKQRELINIGMGSGTTLEEAKDKAARSAYDFLCQMYPDRI
ncbi:hypothetical protein CC2G_013670 [Coprinopsis cinerea AmutBmut pab1-1]|nr:hypothetical protein CC2G_013670 [Coprinopsis cinerea AmutBmut pab1-1]